VDFCITRILFNFVTCHSSHCSYPCTWGCLKWYRLMNNAPAKLDIFIFQVGSSLEFTLIYIELIDVQKLSLSLWFGVGHGNSILSITKLGMLLEAVTPPNLGRFYHFTIKLMCSCLISKIFQPHGPIHTKINNDDNF
jgi:hypothetical protein